MQSQSLACLANLSEMCVAKAETYGEKSRRRADEMIIKVNDALRKELTDRICTVATDARGSTRRL